MQKRCPWILNNEFIRLLNPANRFIRKGISLNLIHYSLHTLFIISIFCSLTWCVALSQHGPVQDNPVLAPEAISPPIIDGIGTDDCWQEIPWQPIAQTWMPYGAKVDSADYFGRYKVTWSATTNLLYFLVEVTDNVFVDGFIPGKTADIYNYDIIEVFIDEDKSGGLHVFDAKDSTRLEWGTNAENAFSYHIYAPFPKPGEITSTHYVGDIAGTSWSDVQESIMHRTFRNSHCDEMERKRCGSFLSSFTMIRTAILSATMMQPDRN